MKIPRTVGQHGAVNLQTEMVCERLDRLIVAQDQANRLLAQLLDALRAVPPSPTSSRRSVAP